MRTAVAAGLALLAFSQPTLSQYRADVPDVLEPGIAADPGQSAVGGFRQAYQQRGSPRIALFWNRVLSDDGESRFVERLNVRSRGAQFAARGDDGDGYETAGGANVQEIDVVRSTAREGQAPRRSMEEAEDWKVGDAFNAVMRAAGARLIDRSLTMRTTAQSRGEAGNMQAVEISALSDKADLLMEVLQTADPNSPVGYSFRVEVKDIRSGQILASVFEDGRNVSRAPTRFVAGPSGFQRETPKSPDLDDMGENLARRVMIALATQWR